MSQLPVAWLEGMYLRPHHFQASDRHWNNQLTRAIAWNLPFAYGFETLSINEAAIAAGEFELLKCSVLLRDGTLIEAGHELGRISLKQALAVQPQVRISVILPRLRPAGVPNLSQAQGDVSCRYVEVRDEPVDENEGANPEEVILRRPALRLCLDSEVDPGIHESLPVARVLRATPSPRLDPDYCPPVLHCGTIPQFHADYVQGVVDLLAARADFLANQIRQFGINLSSRQVGDLERIVALQCVNEGLGSLGALGQASRVHPHFAYVELCRLLGQLSIITPERTIRGLRVPEYDHDDLVPVFRELREQIRRMLDLLRPYEFIQVMFLGDGTGMAVQLEREWLGEEWDWLIGVRSDDLGGTEARSRIDGILRGAHWTMGPKSIADDYFSRRINCLSWKPSSEVPRQLVGMNDQWRLFAVEKRGREWEIVQTERTLVLRFANEAARVGQEVAEVRHDPSRPQNRIRLQFCLFAVNRLGSNSTPARSVS